MSQTQVIDHKDPKWIKFKNKVNKHRPVKKCVDLSQLEIVGANKLKIEGKTIQCLPLVIDKIAKAIKADQTSKTVTQYGGFETTVKLLNNIKKLISSGKNTSMFLTFVANPNTRVVSDVFKSEADTISYPMMFELFEQYLNDYNLGIELFNFDGVELSMSAIDPTTKSFSFNSQREDEAYNPGLLFRQTQKAIQAYYRVRRQICTNGLIGVENFAKVKSANSKALSAFNSKINNCADNGFAFQDEYQKYVSKAGDALASLREVRYGYKAICEAANVEYTKSPEGPKTAKAINDFIDFRQIKDKYRQLGVDVFDIESNRAATGKTNLLLWDVVNAITDFASHDYGWKIASTSRYELQEKAGTLLFRDRIDNEQTIPSLV